MQENIKNTIEDIYELTPLQQGILFHSLYNEGSNTYLDQFCYNLSGKLDNELFKKAWDEIIRRHSIFRTSFQWKGIAKPVQIVSKQAELNWKYFDWQNLTPEEQEKEYEDFLKADRENIFNFEKAPLMRCTLMRLSEDSHKFVWTFQHILMDGWSYPIIQRDVFAVYEKLCEGKEINLPKPLPYKNFVLWLSGRDKVKAEKFWKNDLSGFTSPTILNSTDFLIKDKSHEVIEEEIIFDKDITTELQNTARQNQLTLNTVIQGAWSSIVSTYSGESDIVFGGTVSGRNPELKGVETMAGLFINTLPVRVIVDKNRNFLEWLKELQLKQIERDEFSYTSLVDIQEWSELPRNTQLFDNILVFENYPLDRSLENGVAGIKITGLRSYEKTNFALTVIVMPGEKLAVKFVYDKSVYSHQFIGQIKTNFETLIKNISGNADRRISDIPMITKEEEKIYLNEWNNTNAKYPEETINTLFEKQAEKTPENIAVVSGNQKLTYRELNEKSDILAAYLRNNFHIKRNDLICVLLDKSEMMIVTLLAILKSGGAYVPVDPAYPQDRINYILSNSKGKVLVTATIHKEKAEGEFKGEIAELEKIDFTVKSGKCENINEPGDTAYIIYTSGTTGNPKGCMISHRNVVRLMISDKNDYDFNDSDVWVMAHSYCFDFSVWEMYGALLYGGKLIIPQPENVRDISSFLSLVKENKITVLNQTPLAFYGLVSEELKSNSHKLDTHLRYVIFGGEKLEPQKFREWIKTYPLKKIQLINMYGITETTVHVTFYRIKDEDVNSEISSSPIGKPIPETRVYVFDEYMKLVPANVKGEFFVGGSGVARGYLFNEELTSQRFIKNPYLPEETIYRTGDLGYRHYNGELEYIGRKDKQVKIRGYRIELGEIESTIFKFPGIKTAVVIDKDYGEGDKRLVAYFVKGADAEIGIHNIRDFLKSKLPSYMIPSDFIELDKIPLTSQGKINKTALPEPSATVHERGADYSEPKDTLELQLVKIWEKVLGVKPVGIKDNFFDLGGHSLIALRLFGYIEKLTGKKLPLSTLFSSPTIEQLAVILKDEGWKPQWKSLVAVKPGGSKLPFYYIPPAGGTALEIQNLVKYLPEDQPFYILESIGYDGKEPPHTKIEDMSVHFIKEIQTLQPDGPYMIGGRCFGGRVAYDVAQQLTKLGQKVALLAIFDTWPPFTEKPVDYVHKERNLKYLINRSLRHFREGDFFNVAVNFTKYTYNKINRKIKDKIEIKFSSKEKLLFNEIKQLHFRAQDRYIAKKYNGKITLIESEETKVEYKEKWKFLALGGLEFYTIPGTTHKTIVLEPKLKEFAEKFNYVLEKTHNEINGTNQKSETHESNGLSNIPEKEKSVQA